MEKYFFSSTLLVPMPKAENYTFFWAGTLRSTNETVEIIAFNCDDKSKFQPILESDLKTLKHLRRQGSREIGHLKLSEQPTDKDITRMRNIKNQIRFIKRTLFELSDSVYIKRPPLPMLDIIAQKLPVKLAPENVIYLSGVSRIDKV